MKKKSLILASAILLVAACLTVVLVGCNSSSGLFAKNVKVTLDLNGADGSYQTVYEGKSGKSMSLPTPTRDGYSFDGWYDGDVKADATVFPSSDATLTARYKAIGEKQIVAKYQTDLNKVFGGTNGYYFSTSNFDKTSELLWLLKNANTEVKLTWNMEAYLLAAQSAQFTGTAHGTFKITGASKSDVIHTFSVDNCNAYQNYSTEKTISAKILIGTDKERILHALSDTGFSFAFDQSEIKFRNLTITLSFVIPSGALV